MKPYTSLTIALSMAMLGSAAQAAEAPATEITIEATIARGGDFMAFDFDALWMMSSRTLVRIDPSDNSVVDTPVKGAVGSYRGVAAGEGAVWIPDVGSKLIFKIDPQTKQVVQEIPADLWGSEGSIGVGEGAVWAVTGHVEDFFLRRYSAESGIEETKIPLPSQSSGVVVGYGSVWITGTSKDELYRVDPNTNEIVATIALHPQPRFLASGEGSVWVLNQGDGTVQRIDGKSGELLATIDAGAAGGGGDIVVGGGYVWVTTHTVPVIQIDPKTNSLRGKFKRPVGVYIGDAIRYGAGSLWVSGPSVFRIEPPK